MKNLINPLAFILFVFQSANLNAQTAPVWTRDINALPLTTPVMPVRVATDGSNHTYVLSTFSQPPDYKIYLRKYDTFGSLLWSLNFDNGGTGQPRGLDMVVDNAGNCFIAGGLMAPPLAKPLLMKVDSGGSVAWQRDSTTAFNTSNYEQVILHNSSLYVRCINGIAKFDLNGNETWSLALPSGPMAVDHAGQVIVVTYFGNPENIHRYDSTGVLNFADTTIDTRRIAVDSHNNFYLLTDLFPQYELVKYDSAGNFQWNSYFTSSAPFGDIGFEVLVDNNDDVILVGLNDSIHKLSPSGNSLWKKSMDGLDSYIISAKIIYNNLLAVAGSIPDSTGYNMKVATFDLLGNQNWSGFYNSQPVAQEFTVDFAADNSGIFVIEDNNQNTTLAKFDSPFFQAVDYNLVCVDSVWYDPLNPNIIHVSLFNGNIGHMNYPSVQIVSPTGDTIGNPTNFVNFFAHLGNSYQVYSDTITTTGITDFGNYTFVMHEGFGASTAVIGWCIPQSVTPVPEMEFIIYPNPVHESLIIKNTGRKNKKCRVEIYDSIGKRVVNENLNGAVLKVNVSPFANGIYFLHLTGDISHATYKFIKQ